MPRRKKWSVCDKGNKWGIGEKKYKAKKWSICGIKNKWSIVKKRG
jgi:hypothetical protein